MTHPGSAPPLIVLGVRRSGTTLLRIMLDRNPELAIPDETYFVPALARRHRGLVDPARFSDDLRRLPRLVELGIDPAAVAGRLRPGLRAGDAIGAIFHAYAAAHGKSRWGDKTPLYMRDLPLLELLWPEARFLHLIRDGRDAAVSYLAVPSGLMTESWGHPRDPAGFACQWATEVSAARALGARVGPRRYAELRYEELVADPEGALRGVCTFAALPYDAAMLDYAGAVDVSGKPHQQRLLQPPTAGARDWRVELSPAQIRSFEEVAGDLLAGLGYESGRSTPTLRGRARLASYRVRAGLWRLSSTVVQRSPIWRARHPLVVR